MRIFAAIDLPDDICEQLSAMMGDIPGARWMPDETLHITLRFIGDVDPHTADDVDAALAGIAAKPFTLTLAGLNVFGSPPRVLWAGVQRSEPLLHLVDKVDGALNRQRIEFTHKRYIPHVTLARFREPAEREVADYIQTHNDFLVEPFMVTRFVLFSSYRGHEGVTYTPERYYIL